MSEIKSTFEFTIRLKFIFHSSFLKSKVLELELITNITYSINAKLVLISITGILASNGLCNSIYVILIYITLISSFYRASFPLELNQARTNVYKSFYSSILDMS